MVAAGAWNAVRDSAISSASGPVDAGGQSVAVFTDVVQPERRVRCEFTRPGRDKPTAIPETPIELVLDDDGNEWFMIAFLQEGRDDMEIRCTPQDNRTDNATYATAVIDGFTERAQTGNVIAIVGTVLGIGLAIWTFIARRPTRNKEAGDESA